jgi:hypothetical protein
MLLDASVARSIAVLRWVDELATALAGPLRIAHGVLSEDPAEPCELRGIRDALQREVHRLQVGSGRQTRALSAVEGLDRLLSVGPETVTVVMPDAAETTMALQLSSRDAHHREWRQSLGPRARRLDTGEAVSIAIAVARGLDFASDDEEAIVAYTALADRDTIRTRDVIKMLVAHGLITEAAGRDEYHVLQNDDLHLLGGPAWQRLRLGDRARPAGVHLSPYNRAASGVVLSVARHVGNRSPGRGRQCVPACCLAYKSPRTIERNLPASPVQYVTATIRATTTG